MKIFLASHGKFASGILSSINILFGNTDKLTVYDAYLDASSIYDVLDNYFESTTESDLVVLLSDLFGGSVNQSMVQYLGRPNTFLIAGVNLALVLELMVMTDINRESLTELVQNSREMLRLVELENLEPLNEEDFF